VLVWCARFAGSYGEARAFLNQSRALLDKLNQEKIDLRREEASLCLQEGETEGLLNPEKARPYFQRALALYGKMDDSIGVAKTQLWLGHTEWDTGHYDEAEALLKQALASHQKIGNRRWIVKSLESLGLVHKHIGKFEQAENNHRESFELAREIGDRSLIWTVGTTLAHTLLKTGKYEQAHMLAEDCLCMAREGGNQIDVVYATCALASASIYLGHYDEARSHTEFLIHDARKLGFRQAAGVIRTIEGKLAMIDRDFENAVRLFEESAQLLRKYRKGTWMDPLMWKAYSLRQLGMRKQSRESVAKALQASLDIRAFHTTLLAFPIVALFLADNGKRQRAVELYSLAQRYAHVTDTPWFNEVAGRELTELAISLPDADAARQQGQKEDLWQTARDLLSDLTGWGYIISSE
jgi:tetratricopeptide (TPR) repeat protein